MNTRAYEQTVLSVVLVDQIRDLQTSPLGDGLIGCFDECEELGGFIALAMKLDTLKIARDDIVLSSNMGAIVRLCLQTTNGLFVVGTKLRCIAALTAESDQWQESDTVCAWAAQEMALAAAWHKDAEVWAVLRS